MSDVTLQSVHMYRLRVQRARPGMPILIRQVRYINYRCYGRDCLIVIVILLPLVYGGES